jgi:hypothetical protein
MTENEAVETAWSFLSGESNPSLEFHSAQKILASLLPAHLQNRRDFWVVRFRVVVPDDVVESPGMVLVDVDDLTGEVRIFDAL